MHGDQTKNYSMKFPKPRELLRNEYPDSDMTQPELIRLMVREIIHPAEDSEHMKFINKSVTYLKEQVREKNRKVKVNRMSLNKSLYFVDAEFVAENGTLHGLTR